MKHSTLVGGSSAARRYHCPGSWYAEGAPGGWAARSPREESNEAAEEGRMLHEVMHKCLTDYTLSPGDKVESLLGATFTPDHLQSLVAPALDAIRELLLSVGGSFEIFHSEREVSAGYWAGHKVFGTADVIGRTGNTLYLPDFKFGRGEEVFAQGNEQLLFYAGAVLLDPSLQEDTQDVSQLMLGILQPHFSADINWWLVAEDEVMNFMTELRARCEEAVELGPDAPRIPGGWCRWCKARALCPEYSAGVRDSLNDLSSEDAWLSTNPQRLARMLVVAEEVERAIRDLRSHAKQFLAKGGQIQGFTVAPRQSRRRYTDEVALERRLRTARVPVAKFTAPTRMKSPAQMEKALGRAQYHKLVEPFVVKTSSGLNLVSLRESFAAAFSNDELAAMTRLAEDTPTLTQLTHQRSK